MLLLDRLGVTSVAPRLALVLDHVNLPNTLLHGMLGILLFAGALHVQLSDLHDYRVPIAVLSLVGTAVSTAIVGIATYVVLDVLGLDVRLVRCLLFGALIPRTNRRSC